MILKHTQALVFILVLFGCAAFSLASTAPGYLYTADSSSSPSASKDSDSGLTYDDNDLRNMIAHNLGLYNPTSDIPESTKDLISKFGSKAVLKQQKINYLFMVESATSSILNSDNLASGKSSINHKNGVFNLCSGENVEKCILNLLFDTAEQSSLLNVLKNSVNKQKVEAYLYSSGVNTALSYVKNALSLKEDAKGNLLILDNGSKDLFRLKTDLAQCVNNLLEGSYKVNVTERSITPVAQEGQPIIFDSAAENSFVQYMSDLCSISSISKLIRKDSNPSFFTFYINSLAKLEKIVTPEQGQELYKMLNIAYKTFVQNVKAYYSQDEISGQLLVLNPEDSLEKKYETLVSKSAEPETVLLQGRLLTETQATPKATTTDPTTSVIFKSVLIGFALISLWIWIEMFNIEVHKDTVVYAKFLAADYLRR